MSGTIEKKYLPVLRNCAFFNGLNDEEILSVLNCIDAKIIKKAADEYIMRSGDPVSAMGLVLSGNVFIIQEDIWGHRNIMTKCVAGDIFAEAYAAKPDIVLNISVAANTDCEILLLDTRRILTVCPTACEHHNKLIRNLVSVLASRVLMLNNKITHISKRTTRDKLLSYLSSESIRQGSLSFDIPYDRQQLADFLCVERAAMSVELSKLKNDGIIDTDRSHFTIHLTGEDLV